MAWLTSIRNALARAIEVRSLNNPAMSLNDPETWRDVYGGRMSEADEPITAERALSLSAVWMAIKMISGDCSKVPLKVYERLAAGGKRPDTAHQLWSLVGEDGQPNEETTALELWRRYYASALLYENGYIWIDRDDLGRIHGLYNLPPDRTSSMRVRGKLWYVTEVNGGLEPLPAEDVLHLRGLAFAADSCPSFLEQARHDFGLAIAARKFTSKFFANGAHHGGILQVPPGTTKEARDKVEKALEQRTLSNGFRTMVLRDGYRWFSTTVDPENAETIALDDQLTRHVARWFMLNPARLGVKDSVSYNSEEHARRDYFDVTLSYWLSANQAECNAKLRTEQEKQTGSRVLRYQVSRLLWTDTATLMSLAAQGIPIGVFSPDEVRNWFDLNPREDGQGGEFLRPLNMTVAGEPTAEESDDNTDDEPSVEEPDDDERQSRSAAIDMLRETVDRAVRRMATRADRASTDAARWSEFRSVGLDHERAAIQAMLDRQCRAASLMLGRPVDAKAISERMLVEAYRMASPAEWRDAGSRLADAALGELAQDNFGGGGTHDKEPDDAKDDRQAA